MIIFKYMEETIKEDSMPHEPIFVSPNEKEIINEIRNLNFGRVCVSIQNGVIVNTEITKIIKNNKNNRNNF